MNLLFKLKKFCKHNFKNWGKPFFTFFILYSNNKFVKNLKYICFKHLKGHLSVGQKFPDF